MLNYQPVSSQGDKHVNLQEAQRREWDVAEWYDRCGSHCTVNRIKFWRSMGEYVCVCVCVCVCVLTLTNIEIHQFSCKWRFSSKLQTCWWLGLFVVCMDENLSHALCSWPRVDKQYTFMWACFSCVLMHRQSLSRWHWWDCWPVFCWSSGWSAVINSSQETL